MNIGVLEIVIMLFAGGVVFAGLALLIGWIVGRINRANRP
jgi:hypothetical protein